MFVAARGWHVLHTERAHVQQAPMATAATVTIRDAGGSYPSRTLAALGRRGVIEQAILYRHPPVSFEATYPVRPLPLRLAQGTPQSGWEGDARRGDSRIVILGREHGVAFEIDVYFAAVHPGTRLRAVAQRELERLRLPLR